MRNLKRTLALMLSLAMAGSAFVACGDDTSSTDSVATNGGNDSTTLPADSLAGDTDRDDAFYIYMWNDDVKAILDGPFKEDHPDLYERIVYVNTGGSDTYQTKLDAILGDPTNETYPDIVALEADYILKYTNSDYILPVSDLGITAADYADAYQYTLDIASVDGVVKALSWQAAPGAIAVRKSLCEQYLGTSDPAAIQEYFSTWDKVLETARTVDKASNGETKIFSGTDDVKRIYMAARTQAWYDSNDTIVVDPAMEEYMDFAKALYQEELTWNTSQWGDEWAANKAEGSNKVLAWPSCTWFTYWSLDSACFGDYIMINGPQPFYWGGTWLGATSGCSDKDMAATVMKYITCEAESMAKINELNSDYVNNKAAIDARIAAGAVCAIKGVEVLADGQNFLEFFKPLAEAVEVKTMTGEDQTINSKFDVEVLEYCKGTKDKATALEDFKTAVVDTFNYLKK